MRPSRSRSTEGRPLTFQRGSAGRTGPADPGPAGESAPADSDPVEVGRLIALRSLERAPRTRAELAALLRRKGVPEDSADIALDRLERVGLIDDAAYAGGWVRSRHSSRGLARPALRQELRRKGIDDDTAAVALDEIDSAGEEERARRLVDAKLPATRGLTAETRMRRLVGMLGRRGYSGGLAVRVVREQLALQIDLDPADRRRIDYVDADAEPD